MSVFEKPLKALLNNLPFGVFTIDCQGVIGDTVSKACESLLGRSVAGISFLDIFPADSRLRNNAQSWLNLTFEGKLSFEALLPISPKEMVVGERSLEFTYKAIVDSHQRLESILCVITDRTAEHRAKKRAEAEYTLSQVLIAAANDRAGFIAFAIEMKRAFTEVQCEAVASEPRVDHIFRLLHGIKGSLGAYAFADLSRAIHQLETTLAKLKGRPPKEVASEIAEVGESAKNIRKKFEGFLREHEDVLGQTSEATDRTKTIRVKTIHDMSRQISSTNGRESTIHQQFLRTFVQDEVSTLFLRYENLVKGIAERQEKQLEFKVESSQIHVLSEPYLPMISAYIHVFRNAVDHGIEAPNLRVAAGKSARGSIRVSFETSTNAGGKDILRIMVIDDGKGIDATVVRRKAIEKEIGTADDLLALSDDQVVQLLFHTGFSTRDEVTDLSGRGVGLDAVQYEVERMGGRCWIETKAGAGTMIIAEVPLFRSFEEIVTENDFFSKSQAS